MEEKVIEFRNNLISYLFELRRSELIAILVGYNKNNPIGEDYSDINNRVLSILEEINNNPILVKYDEIFEISAEKTSNEAARN